MNDSDQQIIDSDHSSRRNAIKAEISRRVASLREDRWLGGGVDADVQLMLDGTTYLARKKVRYRCTIPAVASHAPELRLKKMRTAQADMYSLIFKIVTRSVRCAANGKRTFA